MSDREPTLSVVDGLGHDSPSMTVELRRQILDWLDLENAVGGLSPGLAELRHRLRAETP